MTPFVQYQVDPMAIEFDLDQLQHKIQAVRAELLDDEIEDVEGDSDGLTPTAAHFATPSQACDITTDTATPSRFAKICSRFAFGRKANGEVGGHDSPFSDVHASTSSYRRGSVDSDLTLVESLPYLSSPMNSKDDGRYLTLLAPLVACLQRVSPSLRASQDPGLRITYLLRCEEMSDLLKELQKEALYFPLPGLGEFNNDDMRMLLLTALHKKVMIEQTKYANLQTRAPSPLIPVVKAENPFILHSATLGKGSTVVSRTPSPPKAIAPVVKLQEGGFSDFMGHSQQTWRMNVHRLGSFQASALFSPSPIAVNTALRMGVKGKR